MIFTIIASSLALLAAILNLIAFGFPSWTRNSELTRQLGIWSDCGLTFNTCQSWYRTAGSPPDWIRSAEVVLSIAIFFYLPPIFIGFFSSCICVTKKFPAVVCGSLCLVAACFLIAGTAVMATYSARYLENLSPIKGATQLYWATWVSVAGIVLLFQAALFYFIDLCWVRRHSKDNFYSRRARDPLPPIPSTSFSPASLDPDIKNLLSSPQQVPVDVYVKKMHDGSTRQIHLLHMDDELKGIHEEEPRPASRIRRTPSMTSLSSMSRTGSRSSRSHSFSSHNRPHLPQMTYPPSMSASSQCIPMLSMMPFGANPQMQMPFGATPQMQMPYGATPQMQMPFGLNPQMPFATNPQMTAPVMMNPVFQLNPMMQQLYAGSPYQAAPQFGFPQAPLGYNFTPYPIYVPESSCSCSSSSASISSCGTGTS